MEDKQEHLLVVDDDREIRELLADYLERQGYRMSTAANGGEMRRALDAAPIDLVILDVMMPGEDGLTLCRELRAHSSLPIIMLTARGEPVDRIVGLEMGADDYLAKPFEPRELLARIRSVLRRARALPFNHREEEGRLFHFADWTLEVETRQLIAPDGVAVALSGSEYRLLRTFIDHAGRVLNRDQLLNFTRGRDADPFDRSIDLAVSRLRQKLRDDAREPKLLKTVRNEGYVLTAPVRKE